MKFEEILKKLSDMPLENIKTLESPEAYHELVKAAAAENYCPSMAQYYEALAKKCGGIDTKLFLDIFEKHRGYQTIHNQTWLKSHIEQMNNKNYQGSASDFIAKEKEVERFRSILNGITSKDDIDNYHRAVFNTFVSIAKDEGKRPDQAEAQAIEQFIQLLGLHIKCFHLRKVSDPIPVADFPSLMKAMLQEKAPLPENNPGLHTDLQTLIKSDAVFTKEVKDAAKNISDRLARETQQNPSHDSPLRKRRNAHIEDQEQPSTIQTEGTQQESKPGGNQERGTVGRRLKGKILNAVRKKEALEKEEDNLDTRPPEKKLKVEEQTINEHGLFARKTGDETLKSIPPKRGFKK